MIPVTRPWLPDRKRLDRYLDGIYQRHWLTNNGPLVQELTARLQQWLGVEHLLLVANGTLALQVAYRALGISGSTNPHAEAVTSPFSFIATASSLRWEGVKPVFADIDPHSGCLDPALAEQAITGNTRALVPVHVFGNACDVEAFARIAERHRIKLVYDGAHAFGVRYADRSLLGYGDACTLSFHATKLFHSIEGGAVVFSHAADLERARRMINFGMDGGGIESVGINAKMNEFQAAMGLSVLDELETVIEQRQHLRNIYQQALQGRLTLLQQRREANVMPAYFPVLLDDQATMLHCLQQLAAAGIQARRYFHPSLDSLDCLGQQAPLPVSNDMASRILCLPLYADLDPAQARRIAGLLLDSRQRFLGA